MRIQFLGICLVSTLCWLACGSMERAQASLPDYAPPVIFSPIVRMTSPESRIQVMFAEQHGDFLVIDVSYEGGCGEHDFQVVTKGDYTATYPPELKITLVHDRKADDCRSIIDEKRYFDLRPVQYAGTNKVLLVLTNTNKTLEYNY